MAVNIGPKIGIDGEAQFRKEIQNVTQQIKTLKSEMGETESAFSKNTTAMEKARAKSQNLTSQIEAQKTRVEQLNTMVREAADKYGEADTKTLKWKQALAEANTELNNMESELKELPWQTITQIGDGISAASDKIRSAGDTLTTHVTAPLTGVAAAGVKYISDFDTSMSKVRALAGDASQDVSDAVVRMAQETGKQFEITGDATVDAYNAMEVIARQQAEVTKYTAAEAADAMSYMALAGWDVEQMANGLPGVLNLAAASGMDLASASDIVTDQLTAFGYAAEDSAHFADVLAVAQAKSNTTTAAMGEALKYAGPVAGALGYSIEDVSVALGLMANSGIKASTAGTTLRTILQNMASPTDAMASAMETLGVSLEDGNGNMLSFQQVTEALRSGFSGLKIPMEEYQAQLSALDAQLEDGTLSESDYNKAVLELSERAYGAEGALKAQAAAQLAGARGMSGLLAIINAAPEDYASLTDAIYNADGAAEEMAATMQDNLSGKLEVLKSKLGETAFQFLDGLMPVVESAVESIQGLVDKFNALDDGQKKTILRIAAVVAAAGPVLSIVGRIGTGIGGVVSVVGKLGAGIAGAGGLIPAITGALAAAAPVVAVVAGIAAAITAVILVVKNWGEITEWVSGVWESAKKTIGTAMDSVKTTVSNAWNSMRDAVSGAMATVGEAVSNGWNNVKTVTGNAWENIKSTVAANGGGIEGVIRTAVQGYRDVWVSGFNAIDSVTGGKLGDVIRTATDRLDSLKSSARDLWDSISNTFRERIDSIKNLFNFSWNWPHINMPHFSWEWIDLGGIISIPSITIDWYKKAYNNPMLFTSPTVLGTAGGLKGFGDGRGGEVVIGQSMMYGMIKDAVAEGGTTNTWGDINVTVNGADGMDVRELADLVADRISDKIQRRRAVWA